MNRSSLAPPTPIMERPQPPATTREGAHAPASDPTGHAEPTGGVLIPHDFRPARTFRDLQASALAHEAVELAFRAMKLYGGQALDPYPTFDSLPQRTREQLREQAEGFIKRQMSGQQAFASVAAMAQAARWFDSCAVGLADDPMLDSRTRAEVAKKIAALKTSLFSLVAQNIATETIATYEHALTQPFGGAR